jgi:predicted unusual protein kinase regulating ubiquinone biosynthesis (AarF/ABC1/UbiB family)
MKKNNQTVVVKIQRYNIDRLFQLEYAGLEEIGKEFPELARLLDNMKENMMNELDFTKESENIAEGMARYESGNIKVAREVNIGFKNSRVLVLEYAKGVLVNSMITSHDSNINRVIIHTLVPLAIKWLETALVGNGFYHGDLHPGNMFIEVSNHTFKGEVTLIDFGNCGKLSHDEKRGYVLLVTSLYTGEFSKYETAIRILSQSELDKTFFESVKIQYDELCESRRMFSKKINDLVSFSVQNGAQLNNNFVQFTRAVAFLVNTIEHAYNRIRDHGDKVYPAPQDLKWKSLVAKFLCTMVRNTVTGHCPLYIIDYFFQ